MILERNTGFRKGGNCDGNCLLMVVSVSLGAPQKARLAEWLLAWHVWPTCLEELSTLRSGCRGCSVVGLIRFCWGQVVWATQSGNYFWIRILL